MSFQVFLQTLNAEWAMPPPTHTVSSFLRECWGLNLVPHTYAESILQTELSSQSFRVLCYISPKISLLINANCSLHLFIFIPDMIAHKNSTCSVAAMLLAFPLWFRVKTITSQSNVPMSQWVTSFWNECDRKWEIYNFDIGHMGVKFFRRKINTTKTTFVRWQTRNGTMLFLEFQFHWKLQNLQRKVFTS